MAPFCPIPSVAGDALCTAATGVRFLHRARLSSSIRQGTALVRRKGWIEATREHHSRATSPTAEANRSKRFTVRVQITPRAPLHARLAQRQSGGPTNLRSGFRNSHRVPSCACISVAENTADNRGTQVRFLTGAPTQGDYPMSLDGKRVFGPGELNPNGEGAAF